MNELMSQAVDLMIVGMGFVFAFLLILVFATGLMSRLILNPRLSIRGFRDRPDREMRRNRAQPRPGPVPDVSHRRWSSASHEFPADPGRCG